MTIKKTLLTALALLAVLTAKSQTVGVYIFDSDGPFTNVRNSPKQGKVVDKIPVNSCAMFTVTSPQNGWWCILGDSYEALNDNGDWGEVDLKGSTTGYWVHNSVIAISTRNYGDQWLSLRSEPSARSAVSARLKGEQTVRPIDVLGDWVKVKTLDGKKSGWVQSVWLCDNPVTTCP